MKEKLKCCPHCGDPDELKICKLLICERGEEGPYERDFVYCSACGAYGDLDTWNNRPDDEPELVESTPGRPGAKTSLREGVDIVRNALREPERAGKVTTDVRQCF